MGGYMYICLYMYTYAHQISSRIIGVCRRIYLSMYEYAHPMVKSSIIVLVGGVYKRIYLYVYMSMHAHGPVVWLIIWVGGVYRHIYLCMYEYARPGVSNVIKYY